MRRAVGEGPFVALSRPLPSDVVTEALNELSARLRELAQRLRAGEFDPQAALAAVEECARLAAEAGAQIDAQSRAVLEPLPDLPGQLPLPAA